MNLIPFSQESLRKFLTPSVYERAVQFNKDNAIVNLNVRESSDFFDCFDVYAVVKDTRSNYRVAILLITPDEDDSNESFPYFTEVQCACRQPLIEDHCIHSATVLVALQSMLDNNPTYFEDKEFVQWLDEFESVTNTSAAEKVDTSYGLYYELLFDDKLIKVAPKLYRHLKNGSLGAEKRWSGDLNSAHLTDEDKECILELEALKRMNKHAHYYYYFDAYELLGLRGDKTLERLLRTGKVYLKGKKDIFYALDKPRTLKLKWVTNKEGKQQLTYSLSPKKAALFCIDKTWYLDKNNKTIGEVHTSLPSNDLIKLLAMPAVPKNQIVKLNAVLAQQYDSEALPPLVLEHKDTPKGNAIPHLYFHTLTVQQTGSDKAKEKIPVLSLSFQYDDVLIPWQDPRLELTVKHHEKEDKIARDSAKEASAQKLLAQAGLTLLKKSAYKEFNSEHHCVFVYTKHTPFDFWQQVVPQLIEQGWIIQVDEQYEHQLIDEEEQDWYLDVKDGQTSDWFSLDLGIMVQGEKVNLLPVIQNILRDLDSKNELAQIKERVVYAKLPNNKYLPIQGERLYQIMHTLMELFDKNTLGIDNTLVLSKSEAARLLEVELALGAAKLRWLSDHRIQKLAKKIAHFKEVAPVAPPQGLKATLRPYQQEGLNWLQFLREYELAGILADDMGLGKTVQALSHILLEKESGRMTHPALIIAPTSLMYNWEQECLRFAPNLKVLVVHGAKRKEHFNALEKYDIVLTTYPLILRDKEHLLKLAFYFLILDEAQYIKNSKSLSAQIIMQIKATHRLCLTGTPIENHLGELWSLFHFLMPGLLGDSTTFNRRYATPIEKHADNERRQILSRRVAPFILRRTKNNVVSELPPKIETVSYVELEQDQRDLYETIRIAMEEKVRNEIAKLGLARSHIIILDALLKLRQVCCDPQLIKLTEAHNKKISSAKMALLADILPEMVEEGKRILIFSSFTSMLDLIESLVKKLGIDYVRLTGSTKDRKTPIERFQNLEVPLFLISLKAGGTGLNLTAADTVIHVDPWWNPAVENQATDRAYRIGQDKTVFVYKIVTKNTVEEKILEMQEKKRALAESIFSDKTTEKSKLTEADLQSLFAKF